MKKDKSAKVNAGHGYSVTEVGAMLKDIHREIKIIAEGHSGLDKRLEGVEVEVHGNSRRLEMVELTCRVISDKVGHVEDAVSKLNKDLKDTREELKKDIHQLGDRLVAVETRD
jgi:cell division septum initiation protein DivIVA